MTKTATKTVTTTKAVAVETNGRAKKEGLRKAQIRILEALSKSKGFMTSTLISEKASVDKAWVPDALYGRIGDADGKVLSTTTPAGKARETITGYKSLLGLGYVKGKMTPETDDQRSERVWEITANGRKALEKLPKE